MLFCARTVIIFRQMVQKSNVRYEVIWCWPQSSGPVLLAR